MKELKQYKCEVCGAVYGDKERCRECEKQHRNPVAFHGIQHQPMGVCKNYPHKLIVRFDDDVTRTYKLIGGA